MEIDSNSPWQSHHFLSPPVYFYQQNAGLQMLFQRQTYQDSHFGGAQPRVRLIICETFARGDNAAHQPKPSDACTNGNMGPCGEHN